MIQFIIWSELIDIIYYTKVILHIIMILILDQTVKKIWKSIFTNDIEIIDNLMFLKIRVGIFDSLISKE